MDLLGDLSMQVGTEEASGGDGPKLARHPSEGLFWRAGGRYDTIASAVTSPLQASKAWLDFPCLEPPFVVAFLGLLWILARVYGAESLKGTTNVFEVGFRCSRK